MVRPAVEHEMLVPTVVELFSATKKPPFTVCAAAMAWALVMPPLAGQN
jgi:hypothetical protein